MSTKTTGGSAFPTQDSTELNGRCAVYAESGMTLRDYFAAKAIVGLLVPNPDGSEWRDMNALAARAYIIADAMLAERNL